MKAQALGVMVIILPDDPPEKTAGGLYLPPTAESKQTTGKVLSCGEKVEGVSVDDAVVFYDQAAVHFQHENEVLFVIPYDRIMAVLKPSEGEE